MSIKADPGKKGVIFEAKQEEHVKHPASDDIVDIKKTPHKKVAHTKDDNVPLGLRTDFGYPRDFYEYYALGKELGHGQFGTTYSCTNKRTAEKIACKTILKKQVHLSCLIYCDSIPCLLSVRW